MRIKKLIMFFTFIFSIPLVVNHWPKSKAFYCLSLTTPCAISNIIGGAVNLYGVATVASNEVWVVGSTGEVAQFDGTWRPRIGLWLPTVTFYGVSGSSSSNVWIVGDSGNVWAWNGSGWTQYSGSGRWESQTMKGVSVISPTNIWIVGAAGNVWNYDGSWHQHSGSWGGININSVSALSATDVWIAGDNGMVWHYDGISWIRHDGGGKWATAAIKSISAYKSNSVFLVGDSGNVWEYDGSAWTEHSSSLRWGTSTNLNAVSDRYSNQVVMVGAAGNVWEYQGAKWKINNSGTGTVTLNGVAYTRSFIVQNICRDGNGDIKGVTDANGMAVGYPSADPNYEAAPCETSGGGSVFDQGTQKITVTVGWNGGNISLSEYVTRWPNSTCLQTQWNNTGVTDPRYCPTSDYSAATNIRAGSALSLASTLISGVGTLTSTALETIDVGSSGDGGPFYNSVIWRGSPLSNNNVWIQIATSSCPNGSTGPAPTCSGGTWMYYGDNNGDGVCAAGEWFKPTDQDKPLEIKCPALNNKRFFSYKVQLCSNAACAAVPGSTSPTVNDIIFNWSP